MSSSGPTLVVDGLVTQFTTMRGIVHAVNGVSFEVRPGEILGIVGETGCGKSVALRSIMGLIRPPGRVVTGSVKLHGRELVGLPAKQLRVLRGNDIALVGQSPLAALNPVLNIGDQFRNIARAHGNREAGTREYAIERLRQVGIRSPEDVVNGYAHELSGGMAQRVVIALAMSQNPSLLLADEPTTALDVTVQRQILDLIRRLVRQTRSSVIVVTHDLGVVATYCERVVVMYAGAIVEQGPVVQVLSDPRHPYTRALRASVPRLGETLEGISGAVPNLVDYPTGCPYRFRCPHVFDRCATEAPRPTPLNGDRQVACHLAEERTVVAATSR